MTKQNAKNIVDVPKTLHDSFRNFSLSPNTVEADLLNTQPAIEKQARYSAAIREIETAILELKFSIV